MAAKAGCELRVGWNRRSRTPRLAKRADAIGPMTLEGADSVRISKSTANEPVEQLGTKEGGIVAATINTGWRTAARVSLLAHHRVRVIPGQGVARTR